MSDVKDYNDTISALIARVSLSAFNKYDREISHGNKHRVAMARAIGDAIEENISIFQIMHIFDHREVEILRKDDSYMEHMNRRIFMEFAQEIYKNDLFKCETYDLGYQIRKRYEIGVFKIN